MEVQAGAGAVRERLGHERGGHPALLGQDVQDVAERDHPVRRGEGVRVVEVLFELAGGILMVVGVVAPAQRIHGLADGGQVLVHAGDAAGVVAGAGRIVAGVGGAQRPVVVPVHQEVLHLGAHLGLHALLLQPRQGALEDDPRRVGPRLTVDVRIAVDDGQPLLDEGDRGEGGEVRDGDEVSILGLLADQACGVAGEAHGAGLEFIGGFDRHQLGAGLAGHVHEGGQEEADVVGAGNVGEGNGRGRSGGRGDRLRGGGYSRGCDTGHRNIPVGLVSYQ